MLPSTTGSGERVGIRRSNREKGKKASKSHLCSGNPEYFRQFRMINDRLERIENLLLRISEEMPVSSRTTKRTAPACTTQLPKRQKNS
jgi:hypothetical protein